MTVKELVKYLQSCPQDKTVEMDTGWGDPYAIIGVEFDETDDKVYIKTE